MAAVTSAVVGIAAAVATTTASFVQASKQKKAMRQAEADAAKAMAEARKKIQVNYMRELAIKKEPYELARLAATSTAAQLVEAGRESERGAQSTGGRALMAQNVAQGEIRSAMGQELMGLERATVEEQSRLRDIGAQLDLGELMGAQQAAADAQEARAAAIQQGFQGITSLAGATGNALALYPKGPPGFVPPDPLLGYKPIVTPSFSELGPESGGTEVKGLIGDQSLSGQYGDFGSSFGSAGLGGGIVK